MLSIIHLNIRSLPKHFNEFRISPDLASNDIICASETWFNNSHFDNCFNIPGYILIRKDRGLASRGGGYAIYIKQRLKKLTYRNVVCLSWHILDFA